MNNTFLTELGFTTDNGLVHNLNEAQNNVERLYIEEVKQLSTPADAVFFRRFYKSDTEDQSYSSVPSVCIFDKGDSFFDTPEHKELHAALWSAGKIDIYIILGETQIDILNARRPAKRVKNDVSLQGNDLVLTREAIEDFDRSKYSAHLFGSGTFWEQSELQEKIDGNSNPYAFLLDYLMEVRKQLFKDKALELEASTIDKLLITCILVKFLEEIKDDDGKHTLKEIYKKYHIESETFEEGISKGLCVEILEDLSIEFNGKIFDTFSENELINIANTDLTPIAKFLRSDIDVQTNQLFIWEQYSFKHLPAEVISAIYENFIQAEAERSGEKKKGVVYTPLHLVNLLIDESMPLDQPEFFEQNNFKVLDPACGSGVFLVAAYKRMLQWWTINNWQKTNQITYPNQKIAKQILEDNIFGVDIEEVAALVSIFGLTTAFLDKLTPKEIWNDLKFKDLSEKNVQRNSFFTWAKLNQFFEGKFDLVIGNPPFNPPKGVSFKNAVTDDEMAVFRIKRGDIPDTNFALHFFEGALFFGKKICMIIPSNIFLYNKYNTAKKYRNKIFTNYTVEKIHDFTHLRRDLFHKTADTPIVSILVKNTSSQHQSIEHIIVKRELLSEKKTRFEIDYYDKHQVRWDWAIDEKKHFVWKVNLLGGGRLFHFIYRLSLLKTLKDFLLEKRKEDPEWLYRSGYKIGGNTKKKYAKFIDEGDKIINLDENGTYEISKTGERTNLLEAFPKEEMYRPPFIIFSLVLGNNNIPTALIEEYSSKKYLYFNRDFIGIHAPKSSIAELKGIYQAVKVNFNGLYRFYSLIRSSNCLILHETAIRQADISALPYPENLEFLNLSKEEKIIQDDVLNYYIHLGKAISKNSAGKILHDPITQKELGEFGETYCDALNDIYAEDGKSWQAGQVLQTPTFVSYQFGFGNDGGLNYELKENSEQEFHSLFNNISANSGVIHKRIIRHYKHVNGYDCVYFIKPKARRYWLQSIALRDSDDTFMDLKKAGY